MRQEYWILVIGWAFVLFWVPLVILTNRKVHPKVLFWLFMVELWERFSYYGMRAFLVLYLIAHTNTGGFGMDKPVAYAVYAAYGALVYLTPLAGGFLADKILGFRKAIIWGATLMAAGQFTLATSQGNGGEGNKLLLYAGLALLVIGNGFFKPNISSMIGRFYPQGDPRRDQAFTIFYMGINTGAFISPLTCGAVAQLEGWRYGFLLAGTGMVIGLLIFLYTSSRGYLEHHADPPADAPKTVAGIPAGAGVYIGTLLFVPVAASLIYQNDVVDILLGSIGLAVVAFMVYLSFQYPTAERQRIWVIVILLFFTTVFWGFFELAGSALNVFTDENVDKTVFGSPIPASVFQAVNAFFIMIFAPVFTLMWAFLAKRQIEPAAPVKFAIGLLLLGVGFLVLNLGRGAAVDGIMPLIFLILLYLFHTLGELALSPVGLSLVTKLAPARIVGFMMGFWFLSSAIAHQAGKWIAGATAVDAKASAVERLDKSLEVFNQVGLFALGSGVLLLILSPVIRKWMHGIR
jgi:POT family proton-dependent oligopeptide transporter